MDKNILISGVSSGIGYDTTRFLINKDWKVFGSVRKLSDAEKCKSDFGNNFIPLLFDVTDEEAIQNAKKQLQKELGNGQLNAIINNAGYAEPGPLTELKANDLAKQLDVNLLGVMRVTNNFYPFLIDQQSGNNGKIINVSSISGLFNSPFNGCYCISKHALESMSEVYRRELMHFGIDVICIEPGPIKTPIWNKNIGKLDRFLESPYASLVDKADQMIENSEKGALEVEEVSKLIYKLLLDKKPKVRNIIHKNKLSFNLIRKYIPSRVMDKIVWKTLNKKDANKYRPI